MPSSGYTVISFVANQLLTSTVMNQMAANDAAFNSGNGLNDDVINSRHIQLENNLGLNAKNASAIEKQLLRLDDDNYLRLGQLPGQRNTTNTVDENMLIQYGWGLLTYNGTPTTTKAVTYPATFGEVGIVVATMAGDAPTATADVYGNGGNSVEGRVFLKTITQTAAGFTIQMHQGSAANFASGEAYFTWIAIGTKA